MWPVGRRFVFKLRGFIHSKDYINPQPCIKIYQIPATRSVQFVLNEDIFSTMKQGRQVKQCHLKESLKQKIHRKSFKLGFA